MKAVPTRRVPAILQMEAVECGAACLAMILAHHGRWEPLEALRALCGVSRDGSKASNIVKAARRLGLTAKGVRREPGGLADLPMPLVVFWNFNHFIVVESIRGETVRVVDPASGPRELTAAEFDQGFTGVALIFEPGPDFRPGGQPPSLRRSLAPRLRGHAEALALALVAGLLLLLPAILGANLGRVVVDEVLVAGQPEWLWPMALGMLGLAGLRGAGSLLQGRVLARSQIAFAATTATAMMWRMLHLPLGFFSQRHAADLANRFTMGDRVAGILLGGLAPALLSLISMAGYAVALLFLSPLLALVTLLAAASALGLLAASARGIEMASRRNVADEGRLRATTTQGLAQVEEFRAAGMETRFIARWSGFQARVTEAEQEAGLRVALLNAGATAILAIGAVLVLALGALLVIEGRLGLGTLLAFQLLAAGFTAPLLGLVAVGGQVQQLRGLSERLDDIELAAPAAAPRPVPAEPRRDEPGLALDRVSFGYNPLEEPFIRELSLRLHPGERIALVGGSGSGKSTLGRLMVGLLPPRAGEIRLEGLALPDWDPARLRAHLAYVDQTTGLFQGSLRDNLSLWDPLMEEPELALAAQDAAIHDAILRRPGGFATLLDEGGRNLSGGERQRLALARAFAVAPRLLVLDEATSALDAPAEAQVMDAVRRRGAACVIIAHRLSTIRDCDSILVLDHGAIAERGTHAELMAAGGLYRRLVEH